MNEQRNPLIDAKVREYLEAAVERAQGHVTMEQVFFLLDTDRAQLVLVHKGKRIIAVLILEYWEWVSGRRCLKIMLCGGEKGHFEEGLEIALNKVEEIAMLGVCSSILIEGRKGWGRVLPEEYKFSHSVFVKELL